MVTLTGSIHLDALVLSLRTVAVVAVAEAAVTREPVDGEHVLRTGGALPVTVLGQVALVLLTAALVEPGQDLCRGGTCQTQDLQQAGTFSPLQTLKTQP